MFGFFCQKQESEVSFPHWKLKRVCVRERSAPCLFKLQTSHPSLWTHISDPLSPAPIHTLPPTTAHQPPRATQSAGASVSTK